MKRFRGVAFADADLLDAQVVANGLVAARLERGLRIGCAVTHAFTGDPVSARAG